MGDERSARERGPLFRGDYYPDVESLTDPSSAQAHRGLLLDAARKVGVSFISGTGTQEAVHGLLRIVREIEEEMEGQD